MSIADACREMREYEKADTKTISSLIAFLQAASRFSASTTKSLSNSPRTTNCPRRPLVRSRGGSRRRSRQAIAIVPGTSARTDLRVSARPPSELCHARGARRMREFDPCACSHQCGHSPLHAEACGGRGVRRRHPAAPDLIGVRELMTTLMQAPASGRLAPPMSALRACLTCGLSSAGSASRAIRPSSAVANSPLNPHRTMSAV